MKILAKNHYMGNMNVHICHVIISKQGIGLQCEVAIAKELDTYMTATYPYKYKQDECYMEIELKGRPTLHNYMINDR